MTLSGLFLLIHICFICLQIFEGNGNYDTPELRLVQPLLTRFIRIYPERATPSGLGLRMELLGCEIEGIENVHILGLIHLSSKTFPLKVVK